MKLSINNTMLKALLDIERFVSSIPTNEQHKTFIANTRKKVVIQDLDGLALSLELSFKDLELRKIYAGKELDTQKHPYRIIKNCISALRYTQAQKDLPLSITAIQHINKLLCEGYADFWEEGKLRVEKENPSTEHDSFRNRPKILLLEAFNQVKFITAEKDIEHPLLRASVFLYYFLHSYPFLRFNLQTAFVCFYAIIKPTQYAAKNLLSLTKIAFASLQKQDFNIDDSIESFIEKILVTYKEAADAVQSNWEQRNTIPEELLATLNDRQLKGLGILRQKRKLSRRKYAAINGIAIATAFRDLRDLVEKGLAISEGMGRGTFYTLPPQNTDIPQTEPENDNEYEIPEV